MEINKMYKKEGCERLNPRFIFFYGELDKVILKEVQAVSMSAQLIHFTDTSESTSTREPVLKDLFGYLLPLGLGGERGISIYGQLDHWFYSDRDEANPTLQNTVWKRTLAYVKPKDLSCGGCQFIEGRDVDGLYAWSYRQSQLNIRCIGESVNQYYFNKPLSFEIYN